MSELTTYIPLADAVELINGDRGKNYPDRDAQLPSGYCLFLNTKNVRRGYFDFTDAVFISKERHASLGGGTLKRNDIVLTIRGTLGNTAVYSDEVPYEIVRINSAMLIVRPTPLFDPNYIERFLRSSRFMDWVGLNQRGSAQPHLRTVDIEAAQLPLASLSQQQRIVAKIDSLCAKSKRARDQLERVTALVERYKQALFAEIFDQTKFADCESGLLEEFVTDSMVGLVRSKEQQSVAAGAPYIRMNHFDMNGVWNTDDLSFVKASAAELEKYELREGDLLFNTRNSYELDVRFLGSNHIRRRRRACRTKCGRRDGD